MVTVDSDTYHKILLGVTIFTLLTQFYILFLVQFKSPKSMLEYRYCLNTITVFDMAFTIVIDVFLAPSGLERLPGSVIEGWAKYFSPEFQLFCLGLGLYTGGMVIMSQDYCLIYRFTIIWPDKRIHKIFMTIWCKIGFVILQQVVAILLGVGAYFSTIQPNEFSTRLQKEPLAIQKEFANKQFFFWFDIYNSTYCVFYFGVLVLSFLLSEILSGVLVFFIMYILRKNMDKFSKTTYKLHRQFTILLAVQIASPIFFIIAPATACLIYDVILQKLPEPWVVKIGFIWMSFYAPSNALFTIFFISPYRAHFFGVFGFLKLQTILSKLKIGPALNTPSLLPQPSNQTTRSVYSIAQINDNE